MKQIILEEINSTEQFLYEQLYHEMKSQIVNGEMEDGEKCPSIRNLAKQLGVSVTTVMQAYNQLLAEGYITSRPGSGYFVQGGFEGETKLGMRTTSTLSLERDSTTQSPYLHDEEVFDFLKWKKCLNWVFTECSSELLYESEVKGEYRLRCEIAQYLRRSRGVHTNPENIIISAGTQQIAFHLGRILKKDGVNLIAVEKPGYAPVKSMFQDANFQVVEIPVGDAGIEIGKLPVNLKAGAYVNPSNQFPTGVVMPANRRYEILEWAKNNQCYVIEDDYNSELRYFGQPLPPIKSLDSDDRVVYLGSFSSTLFSAIKISYMVLTDELTKRFDSMEKTYAQTCSKTEQLALAKFMEEGYYYTTIKKKRALYTKKLQAAVAAFTKYGGKKIRLTNQKSGLSLTMNVESERSPEDLIEAMKEKGVRASYLDEISYNDNQVISVYYSEIPLDKMEIIVNELCKLI